MTSSRKHTEAMVCGLKVAKAASYAGQAWQLLRVSKVLLALKHEVPWRAGEAWHQVAGSGSLQSLGEVQPSCSKDPDILEITVLWNNHHGQQQLRVGAEDEADKGPGSSGAQRIMNGPQKSSIELFTSLHFDSITTVLWFYPCGSKKVF